MEFRRLPGKSPQLEIDGLPLRQAAEHEERGRNKSHLTHTRT